MSIKITIYDLFAYTIPGGLYLIIFTYFILRLNLVSINFQTLNTVSASLLILIIVTSYIIGFIFDPVSKIWYLLFRRGDFSQKVLDEFKENYPTMQFSFRGKDWPILLACIRENNTEIASEIEKHSAMRIMLRNMGFSLVILAIFQLTIFIFANSNIIELILSILAFLLSFILGKQSIRYAKWFYFSIYETTLAHNLKEHVFVKPKKHS